MGLISHTINGGRYNKSSHVFSGTDDKRIDELCSYTRFLMLRWLMSREPATDKRVDTGIREGIDEVKPFI